jgi:TPR repeat protein
MIWEKYMGRPLMWVLSVFLLALSAFAIPVTFSFAQYPSLDEAKRLFDRDEYGKAAPIYEKLAAEGDPIAQYTLAEMYYRGLGVSQDSQKRLRFTNLRLRKI